MVVLIQLAREEKGHVCVFRPELFMRENHPKEECDCDVMPLAPGGHTSSLVWSSSRDISG